MAGRMTLGARIGSGMALLLGLVAVARVAVWWTSRVVDAMVGRDGPREKPVAAGRGHEPAREHALKHAA